MTLSETWVSQFFPSYHDHWNKYAIWSTTMTETWWVLPTRLDIVYYGSITLNQPTDTLTKLSPMLNTSSSKHLLLKTQHPFCYTSLKSIQLICVYVISYPTMSKQCIKTLNMHKLSHPHLPGSSILLMHLPLDKHAPQASLSQIG